MDTNGSGQESAEQKSEVTIRDLYPGLTEEQLKEAEENLHAYFEVVWRICQRLEREATEGFDTSKCSS